MNYIIMEQSGHILRRKGYKNKIAKGDRGWTKQNILEKETKKITLGNKVRWIFVICFAV